MKAFIFSLCIVFVLVTLIAVNAFFMNNVTSKLSDTVKTTSLEGGFNELTELWERSRLFVSISASHREIDKIDDQIKLLGVAVSAQNANEVKKSKTLLINYIEQIKEHEMLTLDNIL